MKPSERLIARLVSERIIPSRDYTVRSRESGGISLTYDAEGTLVTEAVSDLPVLELLEHDRFIRQGDLILPA